MYHFVFQSDAKMAKAMHQTVFQSDPVTWIGYGGGISLQTIECWVKFWKLTDATKPDASGIKLLQRFKQDTVTLFYNTLLQNCLCILDCTMTLRFVPPHSIANWEADHTNANKQNRSHGLRLAKWHARGATLAPAFATSPYAHCVVLHKGPRKDSRKKHTCAAT